MCALISLGKRANCVQVFNPCPEIACGYVGPNANFELCSKMAARWAWLEWALNLYRQIDAFACGWAVVNQQLLTTLPAFALTCDELAQTRLVHAMMGRSMYKPAFLQC